MTQSNDNSSKNLSIILLISHLFITFIINLLTRRNNGDIDLLGSIGYTIGGSIIVLISFFLLLYKKIGKTGTYIGISLQVIASIGLYCSFFAAAQDSFFVLGLLCGIASNVLYVISMIVLLNSNISYSSNDIITQQVSTAPKNYTFNSNVQIKFCRMCGNKIVEGGKFCNKCATKTDWREE